MSSSVLRAVACVVLVVFPAVAQAPQIVSADPAANSVDALPAGSIRITFSTNLAPATVNAANVQVFGRWSGVSTGTLTVEGGNTIRFDPTGPFACGEQVTVFVGTGVTSAAGAPVPATLTHAFWTASAPSDWGFTLTQTLNVRLPGEGNIITYGAYAGDLDNDGYPDLSLPNEATSDVRVFMNDGSGGFLPFTIHSMPGGSVPSPIEGADLNGDGWTDFVTANIGNGSIGVFINDGTGGLLPSVLYSVNSSQPRGLALLDANSDGNVDALTANRSTGNLSLLLGTGTGTFLPAQTFQGNVSNETSLATGDANGDGITDFFVGGYGSQNVALWLGDGAGGFTFSDSVPSNGRPWMLMSGDVDGDGNVDCVAATSNTGDAVVIRTDGNGNLLPAQSYNAGSFSIAIDLGDLDGDGDLDMIASNYSSANYHVFPNLGNGTFGAPTVLPATGAGSCALVVDIDGDGDAELIGIDEISDVVFVWQTPQLDVQPCSPMACLALDGVASPFGFGGAAPAGVPVGSTHTFTISGHPGQTFLAVVGAPLDPGTSTLAGTLNLDFAQPWVPFLDGLSPACPTCVTGADGNYDLTLTFAPSLPIGLTFTAQAAVSNPAHLSAGLSLTNPVRIITTP